MKGELPQKLDDKEIIKRYIKSIDKGLLKVMSKMGISTYQSYCGAQIFDAVGLKSEFVDTYFTGTATRIEGVGLDEIAEETVRRHRDGLRRHADLPQHARCRRRICVPRARRGPCLERRDGGDAAARGARQFATTNTAPYAAVINEQIRTAAHHPRPVPAQGRARGRPQAGADRGGRARREQSCSASPPAPCRSARSRARRTPRSPSP